MLTLLRRTLGLLAFGTAIALAPAQSFADTFASDSVDQATASVEQIARETGLRFEQERRWQEAILHYEKVLKKHPSLKQRPSELVTRLQTCRVHNDVTRRYSDRSFIHQIDSAPVAETLQVFNEVIAKLEVYFVDRVDYRLLALHGTAFLEVALTEPDFLGKHLRNADRDKVEQFRKNIHKTVFAQRITNADELKATATLVAKLASDQIGLPTNAVLYEYIAGSVGLLDPYSALLTPGEYRDVMSQIEGKLTGLGVELWAEGNVLRIESVLRGGSAATAGLTPQQHILKVDGIAVSDIGAKKAADMLRGPEGSRVNLQLQTIDERIVDVSIIRRSFDVPSVSISEIAEPGIGYMRITSFQKTTPTEVTKSLYDLTGKGARSIIIDLRKNPGGLLDAAVELADMFLHNGVIVSTQGRNGMESNSFDAKTPGTWDIPLVVLIDEDSASASEIFAGAMRDHNRATIVGQTSYGKGSVQGVFQNEKGNGGLRLTVSKFYSPKGHPISDHGVAPHEAVDADYVTVAKQPTSMDVTAMKPATGITAASSSTSSDSDSSKYVSTPVRIDRVDRIKEVGIVKAKERARFATAHLNN